MPSAAFVEAVRQYLVHPLIKAQPWQQLAGDYLAPAPPPPGLERRILLFRDQNDRTTEVLLAVGRDGGLWGRYAANRDHFESDAPRIERAAIEAMAKMIVEAERREAGSFGNRSRRTEEVWPTEPSL